jgi:RNA polymerase sigma factor (sigma-70 family)
MVQGVHGGRPDGQSDAELVARVRSGDEQAFTELYLEHRDAVQKVASQHLRDPDAAADVVQDTFVKALECLPSLRDPDRLRPWLKSIARHAAIDAIRRRSRTITFDPDVQESFEAPEFGPASLAEVRELVRRVDECVAGLSKRDATALAMVAHLGFTPDQVGAALHLTPGAAKVAVHRARRRLRQALVLRLIVEQPSLACSEFQSLVNSDVSAAVTHLESCQYCIESADAEVIPFQASPPSVLIV